MIIDLLEGFIEGAVVGVLLCLFINATRKQPRAEPLEWLDREREYRASIPVLDDVVKSEQDRSGVGQ